MTANLNAPDQTVVAGPRADIEAAIEWCGERGLPARLLPVSCAFHSPHVAPAQRRLAEELERTALATPRIPVFSNATGDRHPDDPEAIAGLLADQLVRPVEFVREVEAMHDAGARVFVEVGPRQVLTGLVGRILGDREHLAVPAQRPGGSALYPAARMPRRPRGGGCSGRARAALRRPSGAGALPSSRGAAAGS